MGEELKLRRAGPVVFEARLEGCEGCRFDWIVDGRVAARASGPTFRHTARRSSWVRVDVRETDGRLALIGNPVWLRLDSR